MSGKMDGWLKYLSATRGVAYASNLVLKCVRQRTIMGFLIIEVLMGIFLMWWFSVHKRVAFLGVVVHHWKTYELFAFVRVAVACWGLYAVWHRRISHTKIYYGLFFLSAILSILMVVPVHRIRCTCSNFLQCAALSTFASDRKLLNPHHPPDWDYFKTRRKVPFKEPPEDEEEAESVREEHLKKISVRLLRKEYSLLQDARQNFGTSAARFRSVKHRTRAQQLEPEPEYFIKNLEGTTEGSTLSSMDDPMVFYNITPQDVNWVGNDEPGCNDKKVSDGEGIKIQFQLEHLARRRKVEDLSQDLKTKLFLCAGDLDCKGVSAEVISKNWLRLCRHKVQMLPVPAAFGPLQRGQVDQRFSNHGFFFLKNPMAVQNIMEQRSSSPSFLYKYAVRSTSSEKGATILRELSQNMCICDEPQETCNYFEDARGTERSWCWVKKSRIALCLNEGVKMYWDSSSNRAWSFDLCGNAACQCSELGMHPMKLSDPNLNRTLLNANKLNYGSQCERWNKDDQRPWCYTGWNTMCADRYLRSAEWTSQDLHVQAMHMQYESALPCDRPEQERIVEKTQCSCENITFFVEFFMVLSILLYVPMMVIVFKFLSNRCGDEFQTAAQFAVVYSTDDESESEDEWASGQTAGATAGARDERGSRNERGSHR